MSVPDRRVRRFRRVAAAVALVACVACRHDRKEESAGPVPSASAAPLGLTPELSAKVLARVGDRAITLGDYAAVLDRMDRLERLRYQTADRRKQLLEEMIDVELFAREAERRGLANRPEAKELVRQVLRDEMVRRLRDQLPKLEDISASDVRAYFDAHHGDFREPERRRISEIVVKDRATSERVLAEARSSTPKQWGELVQKHSLNRPAADVATELAGDVGFLTPPAFGKNDNAQVTEAVRAAAFEIAEVGAVLDRAVEDGGRFHVIRLTVKNPPRDRSLEEADRPIRVRILQDRLHKAEEDFERELKARIPVKVDDAALAAVKVPELGKAP